MMFKRGGVYWTCIRQSGRKVQKSLGTTSKKTAKAIEAKIRVQIAEGKYFEKPKGSCVTVAQMMERFMKEHSPKVSASMRASYQNSLKHLLPFFGDTKLTDVTPQLVYRYKQERFATALKPSSLNRELACISKAFSVAVREWELVKDNPLLRVPKEKENNERTRWLLDGEEVALLATCPDWLRQVVVFAINTGMRSCEILSLEWRDVNLVSWSVEVRESKNDSPRVVPLCEVPYKLVADRYERKEADAVYLFPAGNGKKLSRHTLSDAFKKAVAKAGIQDFTFHDLRHTFGSRLAQAGVDIYTISRLLGHRDVSTTSRYLHHSTESLRKGVSCLQPKGSDYNLTTVEDIEEKEEVGSGVSL